MSEFADKSLSAVEFARARICWGEYHLEFPAFCLTYGQVLILRGDNGAGKSSLLRGLAGLALAEFAQLTLERSRILITDTPTEFGAVTGQTVWRDWQRLFVNPQTLSSQRILLNRWDFLSAGQKRRFELELLAIAGKRLWLLDEPDRALDKKRFDQLCAAIDAHRSQGGAAIIASHSHNWPDHFVATDCHHRRYQGSVVRSALVTPAPAAGCWRVIARQEFRNLKNVSKKMCSQLGMVIASLATLGFASQQASVALSGDAKLGAIVIFLFSCTLLSQNLFHEDLRSGRLSFWMMHAGWLTPVVVLRAVTVASLTLVVAVACAGLTALFFAAPFLEMALALGVATPVLTFPAITIGAMFCDDRPGTAVALGALLLLPLYLPALLLLAGGGSWISLVGLGLLSFALLLMLGEAGLRNAVARR